MYGYDYYDNAAGGVWFTMFFFYLVINVIILMMMNSVAKKKGYDNSTDEKTSHAVVICLFLGIFGAIYIAALPDLILRDKLERLEEKNHGNSTSQFDHKDMKYNNEQSHNFHVDDLPEL